MMKAARLFGSFSGAVALCAIMFCAAASPAPVHADEAPSLAGHYCVSPEDYGARKAGSSDDTAAIQAVIDASRSGDAGRGVLRGTPICFLAGTYHVSRALDFTDGPDGWKIFGAGLGEGTVIASTSEDLLPIVDFTGTIRLHLSDLTVRGVRGGATAAMLLGRSSGGRGDEAYLDNVQLEMVSPQLTHAIAGLVVVCSDLLTASRSRFFGPTGIVLSGLNIRKLNTRSKLGFAPGGGNSCNTLHKIRDSEITSLRGEGILYSGGDALTVDSTYFAVGGVSTAALRLVPDGGGGGDSLYLYNVRVETPSTAKTTYVVDAQSGSNSGRIEGIFQVHEGPYLHLPAGINMAGYTIQMTPMNTSLPLVGGGGSIFNSTVVSGAGIPADLGPMGPSSTTIGVRRQQGNQP